MILWATQKCWSAETSSSPPLALALATVNMRMDLNKCTFCKFGVYHLCPDWLRPTSLGMYVWWIWAASSIPNSILQTLYRCREKGSVGTRCCAHWWIRSFLEAGRQGSCPGSITLYSTLLSPSTSLAHRFSAGSSKGYIHIIQTSGYNSGAPKDTTVKVSGGGGVEVELKEGDGTYIMLKSKKDLQVENVGGEVAEVLLFELE